MKEKNLDKAMKNLKGLFSKVAKKTPLTKKEEKAFNATIAIMKAKDEEE